MVDPAEKAPYEDIRVLILEDNPADLELMESELREAGFVFSSKLVSNKKSILKLSVNFSPTLSCPIMTCPISPGPRRCK